VSGKCPVAVLVSKRVKDREREKERKRENERANLRRLRPAAISSLPRPVA